MKALGRSNEALTVSLFTPFFTNDTTPGNPSANPKATRDFTWVQFRYDLMRAISSLSDFPCLPFRESAHDAKVIQLGEHRFNIIKRTVRHGSDFFRSEYVTRFPRVCIRGFFKARRNFYWCYGVEYTYLLEPYEQLKIWRQSSIILQIAVGTRFCG